MESNTSNVKGKDALGDVPAVARSGLQRLQDQEVEGPLEEIGPLLPHPAPLDILQE